MRNSSQPHLGDRGKEIVMNEFALIQSFDEFDWRDTYQDHHWGDYMLGGFPSIDAAKHAANEGAGVVGKSQEKGSHPKTYTEHYLQIFQIPSDCKDCTDDQLVEQVNQIVRGSRAVSVCSARGSWE